MARIIIVNEKDEVIGHRERNDNTRDDLERVSGLIILNSKNEVLLARRSLSKVRDPGKWGPSVAGTVEEGETYLSNVIKEAQEEVGLIVAESELYEESYGFQKSTSHDYFLKLYSVVADRSIEEFSAQKEEVEEIKWAPVVELLEWFGNSPDDFVASFGKTIDILKAKYQS